MNQHLPGMEADSSDPVDALGYYANKQFVPLRALPRSTSGRHLLDLAGEPGNAEPLDLVVRELMEIYARKPAHWRSILCEALLCAVHCEDTSATRDLLLSYRRCGATLSSPRYTDFFHYTIRELINWCARDATGAEFMDVLALDDCWFDDQSHTLHSLIHKPLTPALLATVDALGPGGWTRQNVCSVTPLSALVSRGDSERFAAMLPFVPVSAFADDANRVLWDGRIDRLQLAAFCELLEVSAHAVPLSRIREVCGSIFRHHGGHAYEKMLFVLGKFPSFEERTALIHGSPPGRDPMEVPPRFATLADNITSNTDPRVLSVVLEYVVNPWNIWRSTKDTLWRSLCTILLRSIRSFDSRNIIPEILNTEALLRILLERRHQGDDAEKADVYGDFYIGKDHQEPRRMSNVSIYMRHMSAEFIAHALETVPLGDARHSTTDYCQWMHTMVSRGGHEVARVLEAHLPDRGSARAYMEQHHVEDVAHIYPVLAKRAACT